jgi:hypothetical protein
MDNTVTEKVVGVFVAFQVRRFNISKMDCYLQVSEVSGDWGFQWIQTVLTSVYGSQMEKLH